MLGEFESPIACRESPRHSPRSAGCRAKRSRASAPLAYCRHAPAQRLPSRPGSLRGGALACLVAPGHPASAVGRSVVHCVSSFTDHGRGAVRASAYCSPRPNNCPTRECPIRASFGSGSTALGPSPPMNCGAWRPRFRSRPALIAAVRSRAAQAARSGALPTPALPGWHPPGADAASCPTGRTILSFT